MKAKMKLAIFAALAVLLIFPSTALAKGESSSLPDEYVFGDNYTLEDGETLDEDLYVFGGNVVIEENATLSGDIWLTGGNLTIDGTVGGDVHATGGSVTLGENAVVDGDIVLTGASIDRDPEATVGGDITRNSSGNHEFAVGNWSLPNLASITGSIFSDVFSVFLWSFLMGALAVLVVAFWPRQAALTGATAIQQPLVSIGLSLAAVAVLVVLAITIILSPVSALGFFLLGLVALFGWVALGYEVGQRLMRAFKVEWAVPVSAGLGTLLLTFVASSISAALDCFGWPLMFVAGMIGTGAALITRMGTQPYPPVVRTAAPVAAVSAPVVVVEEPPAPIVTPDIPPADEDIPPAV